MPEAGSALYFTEPGMERQTRQREAIRNAFDEERRPLSPDEVLALAQRRVPQMGIATVYRTISALVASGWLSPVKLPGEATRYERMVHDHHHHFRCRICKRAFRIFGCIGHVNLSTPAGFVAESHDITVNGVCAGCSVA
jgi:Fur family ferric uptake transcriptional regulator